MKILGIDPGLNNIGIAIVEKKINETNNEKTLLKSFSAFTIHNNSKLENKIDIVIEKLNDILIKEQPDLVLIEDYKIYNAKSNRGSRTIEVIGVIKTLCILNKIKYKTINYKKWSNKYKKVVEKELSKVLLDYINSEHLSEHAKDALKMTLTYDF